MYKVKVENACRCFLKAAMVESQEFDTKDEAQKEAEYMIGVMKSTFCQKHKFKITEQFGDFKIFIVPNN